MIKKFSISLIKIVLKIVIAVFVLYSVVFSVICTVALVYGYRYVTRPLNEVKYLIKNNPHETSFMNRYREDLRQSNEPDSLLHSFIPIDSISDYLKKAVIAAEDDGFYTHPGIDIDALLAALDYNRSRGSLRHGGSTITQQLAKNLFLGAERSYERKIKELLYTVLLEKQLGKKRILELYLNYAQWGKNIFGCEAASQEYYKKSAQDINRTESMRLAATLAMPSKITPNSTRSTFMSKRLVMIANNLFFRGSIDEQSYTGITGLLPPGYDTLQADSLSILDSTTTVQPSQVTDENTLQK